MVQEILLELQNSWQSGKVRSGQPKTMDSKIVPLLARVALGEYQVSSVSHSPRWFMTSAKVSGAAN